MRVMVDVGETIVIERPIEVVAAYAGDPSNAPAWHRRVESAEWQTEPPMKLGSRITLRSTLLGRDVVSTYEVTEHTPGEQVAMRTTGGPFPMSTTSTWRPVGDRVTHMSLHHHGEPSGPWRLAAPLVARAVRRAMREDLAELKRLLESDDVSH